jgi:hypothetical protein
MEHTRKDRNISTKDLDCPVDENSTPDEISECIARTRRDLDDTLNVVEKKIDPSRIYDKSVGYVRENYRSELDWLSDIPRKVKENPESFIALGTGMVIGGLGLTAYALSLQRKHAGTVSSGPGMLERGKQKWHELRGHEQIPERRREAHLRPRPETVAAGQSDQASTEEIFSDQFLSSSEMAEGNRDPGRSSRSEEEGKAFLNREVDIRMGEEQFKEVSEKKKK